MLICPSIRRENCLVPWEFWVERRKKIALSNAIHKQINRLFFAMYRKLLLLLHRWVERLVKTFW